MPELVTVYMNERCISKLCPPTERAGGHIVFGADPVGVGVSSVDVDIGVTLSCLHDIL